MIKPQISISSLYQLAPKQSPFKSSPLISPSRLKLQQKHCLGCVDLQISQIKPDCSNSNWPVRKPRIQTQSELNPNFLMISNASKKPEQTQISNKFETLKNSIDKYVSIRSSDRKRRKVKPSKKAPKRKAEPIETIFAVESRQQILEDRTLDSRIDQRSRVGNPHLLRKTSRLSSTTSMENIDLLRPPSDPYSLKPISIQITPLVADDHRRSSIFSDRGQNQFAESLERKKLRLSQLKQYNNQMFSDENIFLRSNNSQGTLNDVKALNNSKSTSRRKLRKKQSILISTAAITTNTSIALPENILLTSQGKVKSRILSRKIDRTNSCSSASSMDSHRQKPHNQEPQQNAKPYRSRIRYLQRLDTCSVASDSIQSNKDLILHNAKKLVKRADDLDKQLNKQQKLKLRFKVLQQKLDGQASSPSQPPKTLRRKVRINNL